MSEFNKVEIDPDLEDIMASFIENTLLDLEKISKAYEAKNDEEIAQVCHRILGSAESYGFIELDLLVKNCQSSVKSADTASLKTQIATLVAYGNFLRNEYSA